MVVSWMHRLVLGGFCLVFGAVLASAIFRDTGVVFAIPGLALLVVGVLAARGGRVEFHPDELVIRQTWRTRRLSRQDVIAVGVTRGSNVAGLPWRVPFFKPRPGPHRHRRGDPLAAHRDRRRPRRRDRTPVG